MTSHLDGKEGNFRRGVGPKDGFDRVRRRGVGAKK